MFIKAPVIAYTFDRTRGTYVGDLAGWDSSLMLSSDFYGNGLYLNGGLHGKIQGSPWTGGAMTVSFTARFDSLNPWSRVFDFGDGPNSNNILFANAGNTNTASFRIIRNGVTYALEIPDAITVGSDQMWVITVDANGLATVYRTINGLNTSAIQVALVRQQMVVPEVDQRSEMYIGRSNWSSDGAFHGEVDNFFVFDYAMSQEQAGQYFSQMSQSYTTSTNVWDVLQSNYSEHGFDIIDPSRHWVSGDSIVGGTGVSEQLVGSDQPDHIFPNGGTDTVYAFGGDDVITISADWGSSVVTVHGGTGTDTVYYISRTATADDRLLVDLANQGSNQFLAAGDVFYDVENVMGLLYSRNDLRGNELANFLVGGAQQDLLMGRGGNDVLWGLNHNDTISGGAGDDQLDGGHFNDYLYGEDDRDILKGGSGDDQLYGDNHADQLYGEEGADSLFGGAGDDILDGGGDTSVDTLYGGSGNDTYHMRLNDVTVGSGYPASEIDGELGGIDTVITYGLSAYTLQDSFETLTLGAGSVAGDGNGQNNKIVGNTGNNTLFGHGGDDEITGDGGRDTMSGGAGNDIFLLASSDIVSGETIDGGADYDRIVTASATLNLSGMSISNVEQIATTSGTGTAFTADLLGTALIVWGGSGHDSLYFSAGTFTASQVEQLFAQGLDSVTDASGARSRNAPPVITSDGGGTVASPNPLLVPENTTYVTQVTASDPNAGAVLSYSIVGSGSRFQVSSSGVLSFVWAPDFENPGGDGGTNQYSVTVRVSDQQGASDEQTFYITVTNQLSFSGTPGPDYLTGDNGDDIMDGRAGDDTMAGLAGSDIYYVDEAGDRVIEDNAAGRDLVYSSVSFTLAGQYIEDLTLTGTGAVSGTGNERDNSITGNYAANRLSGGAGNDTLDGNGGNDTLVGGPGNDVFIVDPADIVIEAAGEGIDTVRSYASHVLAANVENLILSGVGNANGSGNSGINNLTGNAGNNVLDGLGGADTMTGGAGNDTYFVDHVGDTVFEGAAAGIDVVHAAISWTLGAHLEGLTLTGTANIDGTGNGLDNSLNGNSGNNVLDGGLGGDIMAGGLGDDTYIVENTGDRANETSAAGGNDLVLSSVSFTLGANVERLTLTGTGHITGVGNALANTIIGNSGNNAINGGAGADTMTGGFGNDSYFVDDAGDVVNELPGGGVDSVSTALTYTLSAELENLTLTGSNAVNGTGNAKDNIILGNSGANTLTGNAGNDTLNGGLGADTMLGGLGNDIYVVNEGGDVVSELAGQGTDTVQSAVTWTLGANFEILTLTGSAAIDGTGNALNNVLNGSAGANVLNGKGGADNMFGGAGDDTYIVSDIGDKAFETSASGGNDHVLASISFQLGSNIERLTLTGTGNINGFGNEIANIMIGNAGNNTLSGGAGADTMTGGVGHDIYYVDNAGDTITENASEGTDTVMSSIAYTLGANLENLTLTGSAALNGTGNDANNVIIGNAGANSLSGGIGNDTLNGAAGADTLTGGAGDDIYVIDSLDTLVELAGGGNDTVQSAQSYTLLSEFEYLTLTGTQNINGTGNAANNVLNGNSGNNTLDGAGGADNMFGGAGNDTYVVDHISDKATETNAANGTDTVLSSVSYTLTSHVENLTLAGNGAVNGTGNELANVITGNGAANTLIGGLGADTLNGGAGNDIYLYLTTGESTAAARDTILGFHSGDKINLSQIDAIAATTGTNDAFTFIGGGAFTNVAGQLRAYQSGTEWIVEGDTDGNGAADLVIGVTPATGYTLTGADFVF